MTALAMSLALACRWCQQPTNSLSTATSCIPGVRLDTFLYTALLGQPSEVVSHCPVTAQPITLAMTPDGITTLSPTSSVISLVIPDGSIADCRRSAFCNHGHFFATAEAGAAWLNDHPNGLILPIADAHRLGQLLAGHRLLLAGDEGHVRRGSYGRDPIY